MQPLTPFARYFPRSNLCGVLSNFRASQRSRSRTDDGTPADRETDADNQQYGEGDHRPEQYFTQLFHLAPPNLQLGICFRTKIDLRLFPLVSWPGVSSLAFLLMIFSFCCSLCWFTSGLGDFRRRLGLLRLQRLRTFGGLARRSVRFRCSRRWQRRGLGLALLLARCRDGSSGGSSFSRCSCRCGLGCPAALGRWRWWRWWRWRRQWLQEFQRFGSRAQLAVQQQHEHILRDLRIFRKLRRDVQFRHLRKRNFLLHLPPFGEEILDLLRHRLLARGHRQEQDHLRPRFAKAVSRYGTAWRLPFR